jgi:hypothetical protein
LHCNGSEVEISVGQGINFLNIEAGTGVGAFIKKFTSGWNPGSTIMFINK